MGRNLELKPYAPLLMVLMLVSTGFVGVSNTAIESEEDMEQPLQTVSPPMDSPWSMKCHDVRHTGRSPYSTENVTGLEKWRFRCDGVIDGMVIDNENIIYFGDKDAYVYALYPNGTLKWKYKTDMWITSTPALAEDNILYVGSWDDYLYALNSTTGILKWRFNAHDTIASSPIIAEDNSIYFGTMGDGYRIYAVNPDGTERWHYDTGYKITSDPAIGFEGTIYIGSGDTYLYAINPNGTLKWRFKTGDYVKGPPSIADDETVYIGSFDSYLYAIYHNNGTMKWRCKVGLGTETNPSIASDNSIYVGGGKLYAVNPDGTMKWAFNLGEDRYIEDSSPAISAEGSIYIGTHIGNVDGGDIIAINPDGTERWRKQISDKGWIDSSPCIAEDNAIYIGSQSDIDKGYLHAFGPVDSNSPPETPTISGDTNGYINEYYKYKIKSVDPDNNPVSFYIDWGDGDKEWTFDRASGETDSFEHTWKKQDNYTIRVKARDTLGEESDWATLEVTMPKSHNPVWWLNSLLDKFSLLQRLLGWLMW